jgi:diguanylate cyclase (GGDEF)-like protein
MEKDYTIKFRSIIRIALWLYPIAFYSLYIIFAINAKPNQTLIIVASMFGIIFSIFCFASICILTKGFERRFWGIMLLSCIFYFTGDILRLGEVSSIEVSSFENISFIFYLINATLILLAAIYLFLNSRTKKENQTLIIDSGIIFISLITILWGFYIYPLLIFENASIFFIVSSAWYPMTDIGYLIVIFLLLQVSNKLKFEIKWLLVCLGLLILVDLLNILFIAIGILWILDLLTPIWIIAYIFAALGGINRISTTKPIQYFSDTHQISKNILLFLPYPMLIALMIVMLIDYSPLNIYQIGAAVCSVLIILKQLIVLKGNKDKILQMSILNNRISASIQNINDENSNLEKQTEIKIEESIIDGLTGLYNKKYLEIAMPKLNKFAQEVQKSISAIMIDIDDFKAINDNFGHSVGDETLIILASIIKKNLRDIDIIVRFGGDEFVLFLPGINLDDAYAISENIRLETEKHLLDMQGMKINCTISAGLAEGNLLSEELNELISRADKSLYKSKSKGKNRSEKS